MGQSLQKAAEWTSVKDSSGGKLEFTKLNEELLNRIIQYVDGYSAKFPAESKLVFRKPLKWVSTLKPSMISASGCTEK